MFKSSGRREFSKYPEIAQKISSMVEYRGEEHCKGCRYLKSISDGHNNTGSPATWKLNMMTHHITTMAELIK